MEFKKWLNDIIPGKPLKNRSGEAITLYHGTDRDFTKFDLKKSTMGLIWFTTDKEQILKKEVGAQGSGFIISANIDLENPANWKEYDRLLIVQLKQEGYDGAVLEDKNGHFDAFVFDPRQIHVINKQQV